MIRHTGDSGGGRRPAPGLGSPRPTRGPERDGMDTMRRNTPLRDRLAPPRVVVWLSALALIGLAAETEARGQAPGGQPPRPQAPRARIYAPDPTTPLEFWDAADYLVRTGQS